MIWEILFWLFFGLILYTYLGYPLLLILFTAFKQRHSFYDSNHKPYVSLIISAFNEEKIIRQKIENALNLQYPKNKLSIVVASDGSTDATEEIVHEFAPHNIQLLKQTKRGGKTSIQNYAANISDSEILVFSDANAMYQSDAIEKLVRHFSDKTVGCVCGELSYWNRNGSGKSIERIQGLTHDPNIYGSSLVYLFIDSFSQHCFYLYNSIPSFRYNWVVQVQ